MRTLLSRYAFLPLTGGGLVFSSVASPLFKSIILKGETKDQTVRKYTLAIHTATHVLICGGAALFVRMYGNTKQVQTFYCNES